MGVFVIAEAGSSHDNDLQKAYRLIEAAKECGADAVKFQWTSSGDKLRARRQLDDAEGRIRKMYQTYLEKPVSWLESLKAHADKVGIEFMCTVYLIEDIAVIAPLVKRFKVSAFESTWTEFVEAHYYQFKETIISSNDALNYSPPGMKLPGSARRTHTLHCISKYPTPRDAMSLRTLSYEGVDGLSDHSGYVLTGAMAVSAGAQILEVHCRLFDTSPDNPDYRHSLPSDCACQSDWSGGECLHQYIKFARIAESML